jgi:hypothetical protein
MPNLAKFFHRQKEKIVLILQRLKSNCDQIGLTIVINRVHILMLIKSKLLTLLSTSGPLKTLTHKLKLG